MSSIYVNELIMSHELRGRERVAGCLAVSSPAPACKLGPALWAQQEGMHAALASEQHS